LFNIYENIWTSFCFPNCTVALRRLEAGLDFITGELIAEYFYIQILYKKIREEKKNIVQQALHGVKIRTEKKCRLSGLFFSCCYNERRAATPVFC
jgi:hypothetical protein